MPIPEFTDLRPFNVQLEKQALVWHASFVLLRIPTVGRDELCAGRAYFSPLTIKVHIRQRDMDACSEVNEQHLCFQPCSKHS